MKQNREDLQHELEERTTEELVSILRNRDEEEWRPEVFEVVASILTARGLSLSEVVAMGPESSEGFDVVEAQPLVTLGKYFSPIEAHAQRLAIEQAGIDAWVSDEVAGGMYGVGIGARLQVRAEDEAAARAVLEAEPVTASALPSELAEEPCPKCGSPEVTQTAEVVDPHVQPNERGRRTWRYHCASCGNSWSEE